jgi:hypothetical protein
MKPFTKKQQQWLWFVVLWCGGLAAAFLLAYATRWLLGMH